MIVLNSTIKISLFQRVVLDKFGEKAEDIKAVFLCSSPINAISAAIYAMLVCKSLLPNKTMLMVVDDSNKFTLKIY